MQSVSVIVPCCNEEEAVSLLPAQLFPVLERLRTRYTVELILVDDGSTDDTWTRLIALAKGKTPCPVVLRRHSRNEGLGAALQTGCKLAVGDIIVTVDADGTYPFSLIETLVAAIDDGADLATASPYHRAGGVEGVAPLRLFFSRGASLCYRALVDRRIATYTAMVRAYRAPTLHSALSDETGFLHVAKTLVEARRHGARVTEAPAVLARRQVGVSKAKLARTTRAHLRYLSRIAWLRATGHFWAAPVVAEHGQQVKVAGHG